MKKSKILFFVAAIVFLVWIFTVPSNSKDWSNDQKILSYAEFEGNKVNIFNIRNFTYYSTNDYVPSYYNETFDLEKIDSLWFIVEPFSGYKGAAHTFFSFGFADGEYISVSVEIRKEKGESFSAVKGLAKNYELMYVIGDENDLIKLRSNYRNDTVYLYEINASKEKIRMLFVSMLNRTNELYSKPEFYNTLTSTCTTNIMSHVNDISPKRIPFDYRILFPEYSDELAFELGLIKTNSDFEETRQHYKINERAVKYSDYSQFSVKIREFEDN